MSLRYVQLVQAKILSDMDDQDSKRAFLGGLHITVGVRVAFIYIITRPSYCGKVEASGPAKQYLTAVLWADEMFRGCGFVCSCGSSVSESCTYAVSIDVF